MLQSSFGGSCTALAGSRWNLAGELLLSTNAKGYGGGSRPCLYVKGVQKFLLVIGSTPTDLAKVVGIGTGMLGVNVIWT